MPDDTTFSEAIRDEIHLSLDELARRGAQRMLAAALQAEVDEYIRRHASQWDENGRAPVVRNGRAQQNTIQCGASELQVNAPQVHDRRPGKKFSSNILPPYVHKSPRLEEAVPVLYLRGLSTGDFAPAVAALLGGEAVTGFSATAVTRLLTLWQDEHKPWRKPSLVGKSYVYLWANGVHFNVRLEGDCLACLVLIGVRPDGIKEVVALEDGYRESTESWATVLRDLKHRGMHVPKMAIAGGALGFWAALRDVHPETEEQRCWVHKLANVLDKLPKRRQPRAKSHLHEIMHTENRATALEELARFQEEYKAKYPKAVDCLTRTVKALFTVMDYPSAHWLHLRTTNAIESIFATVKARIRRTKGAGSRAAGLAMAFKRLTEAEKRWRRVSSPHLVTLAHAGVKFQHGKTRILPDNSVVNLPVDATPEPAIHNI